MRASRLEAQMVKQPLWQDNQVILHKGRTDLGAPFSAARTSRLTVIIQRDGDCILHHLVVEIIRFDTGVVCILGKYFTIPK